MSLCRYALFLTVVAFASASCASRQVDWLSRADQSGGSNSDGSKSDNSGGQGSQSGESNSSDGPSTESGSAQSDTHSKSSGTVTTQGQGGDSGTGIALLVLVGLTLAGLTIAAAITALDERGAAAYLEKHGREVRLALARGEGTFVADVAHNLGLAPDGMPHLGAVLHAGRARLEPLVVAVGQAGERGERDAAEAQARGFAAELAQILLADPILAAPTRAVVEDVRARYGRELHETP